MRAIGEFKDQEKAETFSAVLHAEGIDNEAEVEEGVWTIWVQDEENLQRASRELERYRENPHRTEYLKVSREVDSSSKPKKRSFRSRYKQINLGRKWRAGNRAGAVTMGLIIITSLMFLLTKMGNEETLLENYWFKTLVLSHSNDGLPEVLDGEVWRLFTPIFLHGGILHFLFNMIWLFDLGGMIEKRKGKIFFGLFVFLVAVVSNLFGSVYGIGMSGVVCGLFGYAWMKGKYDPGDGVGVTSNTVVWMMGWLILCFAQPLGSMGIFIDNAAHVSGLALGAVWGYFSAMKWRR